MGINKKGCVGRKIPPFGGAGDPQKGFPPKNWGVPPKQMLHPGEIWRPVKKPGPTPEKVKVNPKLHPWEKGK